jgi:hypothetical protein
MSVQRVIQFIEGIRLDGPIWKRIVQLRNNVLTTKEDINRFSDLYYHMLVIGSFRFPDGLVSMESVFNNVRKKHTISFNQVRENLTNSRHAYRNAVNQEKNELPFSFGDPHFSFRYDIENDIFTFYAKRWIGEPLGSIAQRFSNDTTRVLNSYTISANSFYNILRLQEREISSREKYIKPTPVRTYFCYQAIDYEPDVVAAKNDLRNKKEKYAFVLDRELSLYEKGFLFREDVSIPLSLAILPVPGQILRPTIEEVEQQAIHDNPELPERKLKDSEVWCLNRANLINEMNIIRLEAEQEWESLGCRNEQIPTRRCKWLTERITNSRDNMIILDQKNYPDEITAELKPLPDFTLPTQKELDREQIDLFLSECQVQNGQNCFYNEALLIKNYALKYGDSSTQQRSDLQEVIIAQAEVNIAFDNPEGVQPEFPAKRDRFILLRNQYRTTYGIDPHYSQI